MLLQNQINSFAKFAFNLLICIVLYLFIYLFIFFDTFFSKIHECCLFLHCENKQTEKKKKKKKKKKIQIELHIQN